MAALLFYSIVITGAAVFLLAAAHDEVTAVVRMFVDMFTRIRHWAD